MSAVLVPKVPTPPPTPLQRFSGYVQRNRAFFSFAAVFCLLFLATAVGAQTDPPIEPDLSNFNGTQISNGLITGMNLLFGISGLVGILMLPAGLQFAMNIIKGVVGMFQGLRFGG
jgi:hypothetical protein